MWQILGRTAGDRFASPTAMHCLPMPTYVHLTYKYQEASSPYACVQEFQPLHVKFLVKEDVG